MDLAAQLDLADTTRQIEAGITLQAQRLQGDGLAAAANQRIGAQSDTRRYIGRAAEIGAGEGARGNVAARRKHSPDDFSRFDVADIDPVAANFTGITLCLAIRPGEGAVHVARRAEDEADARGDVAG